MYYFGSRCPVSCMGRGWVLADVASVLAGLPDEEWRNGKHPSSPWGSQG